MSTALEAFIDDFQEHDDDDDSDDDSDNRSQGDYQEEHKDYFGNQAAEEVELLIDVKGPKVKRFKLIKVNKQAIVYNLEDYEVLQIDVKRSLSYMQDTLKIDKNGYIERVHKMIDWCVDHWQDLFLATDKSMEKMQGGTKKNLNPKKKDKDLADY